MECDLVRDRERDLKRKLDRDLGLELGRVICLEGEPSKHETLTQCWVIGGPTSETAGHQ